MVPVIIKSSEARNVCNYALTSLNFLHISAMINRPHSYHHLLVNYFLLLLFWFFSVVIKYTYGCDCSIRVSATL